MLKSEIKGNEKRKVYVFSSESLTSFSMFFRFSPSPYVWTQEPNSIARKLYTVFSESDVFDRVKIVMSIRQQSEILKSMYAQVYNLVFKRFKETKSFKRFLRYTLIDNADNFLADALQYDDVVKTYEDLFGPENVGVQVFEELLNSRNLYIQKLSDFMCVDTCEALRLIGANVENERSGDGEYYLSDSRNLIELLSLYKNRIFRGKKFGLSDTEFARRLSEIYIPGKKLDDVYIPGHYQDILAELYTHSNRNLSERRGLDLARFGYF